ncbi:MAG TPA: hypothetical protein VMB03_20780 [Bryobacteraceae bacterium]|nr:hypothetical protein [Bryobacteraceae bacterium]
MRKMEASGDVAGARALLARAAETNPHGIPALTAYAEFLERYGDPGAKDAYAKLLATVRQSGDTARADAIGKRIALLDLVSGTGHSLPALKDDRPTVPIPGPLRSFARMVAISGDARPNEILQALARNVVTNGYQASHSNEALEQTEYLKLVHRYLSQAQELQKLAGDTKVIKIDNCDSPQVAELLRILGFRIRGGCGSEVVLETVNAARAFLTTDSGFPINVLEESLRTNRPFVYDYHPTSATVIFGPEYWTGGVKEKDPGDFIDTFISDPSLCRLYLGFSKLDSETAEELRKGIPFTRVKAYAHILDFFGGMFEIRGGKALVPGGPKSAALWGDLAGASPDHGADFFDKLMAKDDGWLASLYDSIARMNSPLEEYLLQPERLKRFYTAIRGRITSPGPARPVFRSNTDMMLLTTRLRLDPDGKPHIPGNLDVWKTLFTNHPQGKYDGKLTRLATTWKDPDDVIEALFALCRKTVENEPLKIFMAVSDLDRYRQKPLDPVTVDRLARDYHDYGAQYAVFSESHSISDRTITQFLDTVEALSKVREPAFRSDTIGSFQSLVSLWQILVRQGSIPDSQADATLSAIAGSFPAVHNNRELFDVGRENIKRLLAAAGEAKGTVQERVVAVLSGGAAEPGEGDAHAEMAQEIGRILEAQRMVSLDTLFDIADNLAAVPGGTKLNIAMVNKLTAALGEIPPARAALTGVEQNAMGYGYWTDRHIDLERKLNLRAAIERAGTDAAKLNDIRGLMAPLLRDTLLGFNYAYYAPPGAQILYTNPVFVRGHDFIGSQGNYNTWRNTEVYGTGWPSNAGGRLVGSLATLPYALAEAEQNFLIPAQRQALIWGDLAPQMILSATTPRWWNVTPSQIHWVGLHLRYGREVMAEAASDAGVRGMALESLSKAASPARVDEIQKLLSKGAAREALDLVTPSELFVLARDMASKPGKDDSCLLAEIRRLAQASPRDVNYDAISRAFGTPKPTLANSYEPELLHLRTFPTLMGYSSRIMAESWESNTLYWAALADELNLPPAELNVRIPQWTRKLVEDIFASHLEDWPAVLRSLRQVGEEVRQESRANTADSKAEAQEIPNR